MKDELAPLPIKEQGIYEHYKGGKYRLLFLARREEDLAPVVVYCHLDDGQIWTRPLSDWEMLVIWPDGHPRSRFCKIP